MAPPFKSPFPLFSPVQCLCPRCVERCQLRLATKQLLRSVFGQLRAGNLDLVAASWTKVDDIATVKAGGELAVVDADRNDLLALLASEQDLAIHPVRLHRGVRQDDDERLGFADPLLDPRPEEFVRLNGVAVVEDVVVTQTTDELDELLHIPIIGAAMTDERGRHDD